MLGPVWNATDPDLDAFRRRGGKLIGFPGQPTVPKGVDQSVIAALDRWVSRGEVPSLITATKFVNDDPAQGVAMTRPLCPYPQVAAYDGRGDANDARNLRCVYDEKAWRDNDDRRAHIEE